MDLKDIDLISFQNLKYLEKYNITTSKDLLEFYPYRYQVLNPSSLESKDDFLTINAKIVSTPIITYLKSKLNVLRFKAIVNNQIINVSIFNRGFLKKNLTIDKEVILIGKYNNKLNSFTASEIKMGRLNNTQIIPLYHNVKGIKNNTLEKYIKYLLENTTIMDELPSYLKEKYHLCSLQEAYQYIHFPKNKEELKEAQRRLIFEELFEFMLKMMFLKELNQTGKGVSKEFDENKVEKFLKDLPFTLTEDQQSAIKAGLHDLKDKKRMNRLLLGDVGSGKTIVATVLLYANFLSGYQGVFMAPTEILATQHFFNTHALFQACNVQVDLLVGSMSKKEKENILQRIKNKEIDILIGTHAVLNENLHFANLGLVVTDEQHRFGVCQRESLQNKGDYPDMLFMSATPIPRTYALTLYGDMDTSIIKQKPHGRKDIITKVVLEKDLKEVLLNTLEEIKNGHQVYVVAPMIDENDENNLKNVYLLKEKFSLAYHEKVPIGILHGKMKKEEKNEVMNAFKNNQIKILISTTVVEVGVDVSNATVMIIFNAERFGLATLHQLRGRVGRSALQSYCYLICNEKKERLMVLEESNDGFYISEKDFEFRGEGDLFGIKQSGDMAFKIADLKRDYHILLVAKKEAEYFLQNKLYTQRQHYEKIIHKIDFTN
ncbi:ATP-dependent DNA helicase RecG [bacterium]|uniref:ATP-dependent DNA helicase RecG n=1 Tax=Candidatus Ventrenecus sp. TaxID=3085654 RepID=UPI001D581DC5|nr:ATP-dependent DNA helicase RecG [bacterium]